MLISNPTQLLTSSEIAIAAITDFYQGVAACPERWRSHLNGTGDPAKLEAKLAAYYGKDRALCLSSATTALFAIPMALGLKDAEFITTPLTWGATLAGFLHMGNRPKFVELDPLTQTLCPKAVERAITRDTKAILSCDTFGNPADLLALRKIADKHGLWLIGDAAQSFGASRSGLPASSSADAIVVSFTVAKTLFAGEGGAIVTDNEDLYQKLVWLTQHPDRQRRDLAFALENQFGMNGRIHPLAAVIANASFEASLAELRVHQIERLAIVAALNEIGLTVPMEFEAEGIYPTFFSLVAHWQELAEPEQLITALDKRGIGMKIAELPCRWIPEQASFLAQYGHLWSGRLESKQTVEKLFALQDLHG